MDSEVSSKKDALVERTEVSDYVVVETVLKAGSENIWLWVVTERTRKWSISRSLLPTISKEKNMFVAEMILSNIVRDYGKHTVSTDGGT